MMNEYEDFLQSAGRGKNPFRMPEDYSESFEERLMVRIHAEEKMRETGRRRIWTVLKPALALAASFALIFGMGYGVLSLTRTLRQEVPAVHSDYASASEELIRPSALINYYEDENQPEEEIDEETLINYLSTRLSYNSLAEIYAQNPTK